jgi:hypothetical protein
MMLPKEQGFISLTPKSGALLPEQVIDKKRVDK